MNSLPSSANVTRTELANGVTVLVYEKTSTPSVVVAGTLRGGGIRETLETAGLASMTAEALMRGTANRTFEALHEEMEALGMDLDVDAGQHKAAFSGKALAEDLPTLIELLDDVLRNPTFPEEQIELLRGETLTELNYAYSESTRYMANRTFRETLYPQAHPYHRPSAGTPQTVAALTIEQMREFHSTFYGPTGLTIVVVGAVKADDAVNTVAEKLGTWQNDNQPAPIDVPGAEAPTETVRAHINMAHKSQADLVIGTVGPSRFSDDYHAANLANSVLGSFGMMGRVGDVVREQQGLAYYSYSALDAGYGPGPWRVIAGVDPRNVEKATNSILNEVRRLAEEPVSEEDLSNNQAYFTGHLPLQLETSRGIANTLLTMESYHLGLDYLTGYADRINALTRDDLMNAAQKYLNPGAMVIAVAGPDGKN